MNSASGSVLPRCRPLLLSRTGRWHSGQFASSRSPWRVSAALRRASCCESWSKTTTESLCRLFDGQLKKQVRGLKNIQHDIEVAPIIGYHGHIIWHGCCNMPATHSET